MLVTTRLVYTRIMATFIYLLNAAVNGRRCSYLWLVILNVAC